MQIFSFDNLTRQAHSQPTAHLHYLTNTLFGRHLNVDSQLEMPSTFNICLSALLLVGMIGAAMYYIKRFPLICFCVLWWFFCLIPSNSIIPRLDLVNDRQIYMASIGTLLLIATGTILVANKLTKYKLDWLLLITLLNYTLFTCYSRNWDYESEINLWQASIYQGSNNSRVWNNLGYAYLLAHQNEQAKAAFLHALQLDESNYKAFYNFQQLKGE
jgi:tetratricopeptide (TPR) repeat protein